MCRAFQQRVGGKQCSGLALSGVQGTGVIHQVGDLQGGQTMLAAAEKVAGAAGLQVVLCHGKAIGGGAQEFQPLLHGLAGIVADKEAPALGSAASHPPAQLVQGAQTVALGVFDHHHAGIGHVHAHLDDGGGHQCVQPPGLEILHDGGFLLGLQLAVHQAHPAVGQQRLGDVLVVGLDGVQPAVRHILNGGADQIHLPPFVDLAVQKAVQVLPPLAGDAPGLDRGAPGGQLVQNGDVQVAVDQKPQRAGDRGGTHDQQVRVRGFFCQCAALTHPKAVLLVNDRQTQPGKLHPFAHQGMGAHHKVGFVLADGSQRGAAGGGLHAAGQQGHPHPEGGKQPVEPLGVLRGQNFGRRQQRGLIPRPDARPDGGSSYQRFAAAHIALQQAVHGGIARHIV